MSTAATLALFARLIVSLGVVVGLMWFAARVVRRRGLGLGGTNRRPGVHIDVIARRTLGKNASIAIVRAGDRGLIVGVTDNQITKLADADLEQIDLERRRANGRPLRKGRTARLRHGRRCSSNCGTEPPVAERHRAGEGPVTSRSPRTRKGSGRRFVVGAVLALGFLGTIASMVAGSGPAGAVTAPSITRRRSACRTITAPQIPTPNTDRVRRRPGTSGNTGSISIDLGNLAGPGPRTRRTRTASRTRASSSSCCSRCWPSRRH